MEYKEAKRWSKGVILWSLFSKYYGYRIVNGNNLINILDLGIPDFSNRDEYLLWKNWWKSKYKKLSIDIRRVKNFRKQYTEPNETFHYELDNLRQIANYMMCLLNLAKDKAKRQKEENLINSS